MKAEATSNVDSYAAGPVDGDRTLQRTTQTPGAFGCVVALHSTYPLKTGRLPTEGLRMTTRSFAS